MKEETVAKEKFKQSLGMVDVGAKAVSERTAVAAADVHLGKSAFAVWFSRGSPKGDVLETARIAGIMAAKATAQIIPMCHPLELNKVNITFEINQKAFMITVIAEVKYRGRTGVEMEALSAVAVAALTIYDMMKWADKAMLIKEIRLLQKTGGKSDFKRGRPR